MKLNSTVFTGSVLLSVALLIGLFIFKPVLAQVGATSTEPVVASSSPAEIEPASASTTQEGMAEIEPVATTTDASGVPTSTETQVAATSTTEEPVTDPAGATTTEAEITTAAEPSEQLASTAKPIEPAPEALTKVRIVGTKYTDYFTNGTETFAFPGDPEIGARLGEKDAPIPTREGLTWVHTTGTHLYDTPSGELEVGQYAVQPNGKNVVNPIPFISSTSSPAAIETNTATSS